MKKVTHFTVGPSQLYQTVPGHIQTALQNNIYSLSHRSGEFIQYYKAADANLRKLLNIPKTHHIFFTSSALEAMERTIANTVEKKSFHFVNGSFSREFYQIAIDLKKDASRYDVENGQGFDFSSVVIPKDTELIGLIQNETSTGVATPMEEIYTLKKTNPDALIAIDVVSSVPYVSIDFTYIDIVFFSVQKGFGLPAGLGVLIVNEKALQKADTLAKKGIGIGSYHNFLKLHQHGEKFQTRETPNIGNIYLLSKVTEDMLSIGKSTIKKNTEKKAKMIYDFFDNHKRYKPFAQKRFRSQTTIVVDVDGESEKVVTYLAQKGFIIAKGYGKRKDNHIRIGNFPAHSIEDVKNLLEAIKELE